MGSRRYEYARCEGAIAPTAPLSAVSRKSAMKTYQLSFDELGELVAAKAPVMQFACTWN